MFHTLTATENDYQYALNTLQASYWYRLASDAFDAKNSTKFEAYNARGVFYDRKACQFENTQTAWLIYDTFYKQWLKNGKIGIVALIETLQCGAGV